MEGYKLPITTEQAEAMKQALYAGRLRFNPVPDINWDYFIFSLEVEDCNNPDFMWVKELQLSEYVQPEIELK